MALHRITARLADRSAWAKHYLRIDSRSLALFRIAMSVVLLEDWWRRWLDRDAFFLTGAVDSCSFSLATPSLLCNLSSDLVIQVFLLAAGMTYVLLGLGYRTRWIHALALFFQLTIFHRSPLIYNAGDTIMSCFLWWTLFLPTERHWSLDRRFGHALREERPQVAALAVYLQFAILYGASAMSKFGTAWTDGTALHYFWNLSFASEGARLLSETFPPFMIQVFSYASILVEWSIPFLVLAPPLRWPLRRVAMLALIGLHMGIDATFFTGAFQYASVGAALLLASPSDWDRLGSPKAVLLSSRTPRWAARAQDYVALILLMGCLVEGVTDSVNYRLHQSFGISRNSFLAKSLSTLNLTQIWQMYAPEPGRSRSGNERLGQRLRDGRGGSV